jgi:PAS domain S-box-containing protein
MDTRLLSLAHDALISHIERGDARLSLRRLVSLLGAALGCACCVEGLPTDRGALFREGRPLAPKAHALPLQRMGRTVGFLRVDADAVGLDSLDALQAVLPALTLLLHQARVDEEAAGLSPSSGKASDGDTHADMIRGALAGADTFVWEWTVQNDVLTDIHVGLGMLGYDTSVLTGHTQDDWNRLIHPEDREANHEAYLRHERGEAPTYEHAYRIQAADGDWLWMLERGRIVERDASGRPLRMLGTQTDITLRRAQELAAQQATERLVSIARSVPQVLFQCRDLPDGQREFLYVSEHSRDVLGLEPAALLAHGESLQALIHPEDRASAAAMSLLPGSGHLVNEYRFVRPDGATRWLRVTSTGQQQADGSTLWHGSMEDVTERRALEHSREEAAQAKAASLAKTQFLARMSHELRTPLNAVLGFAQLMEIDQTEAPQPGQQRRLKLIREAGEHLLHMINDMLDLTRIEAGGMVLQSEGVALRALVLQTLEMVQALADHSALRLLLAPGAELTVLADRARLRQVLLNLLTNAIKYNRPGGQVVVEVGPAGPGRALVTVRDSGLGISEADLPFVFEPFRRGAQASGPVDGAGIGLSVTRALVQLMGGQIDVSSTASVGSVFSVELPLATPTHLPHAAATLAEPPYSRT